MKIFKTYIFGVFIALLTLVSCTSEEIIDTNNNNESASVQTALTQLRTHFNEDGSLSSTNNPVGNMLFDFCFDFVYPITLTYNTGADVTVHNFDDLLDIVIASTNTLYINGISFPFQVETYEGNDLVISTITNENEFIALILSCDFGGDVDCDCTEEYAPVCVEMNDPSGESFTMEFPNECIALCEGFTEDDFIDCEENGNPIGNEECFEFEYPISVTFQNETTVINSDEEFEIFMYGNIGDFEFVYPFNVLIEENGVSEEIIINNMEEYLALLESCEALDPCMCPQVYDPVCIATPSGGTIEFQNLCYAACEGFTQNDVVDCDTNNNDCEITNVVVTIGECIDATNYTVVLDFDVANTTDDHFDLFDHENELIGYYAIADLPITITVEDRANSDENWFEISINDNADCAAEVFWTEPNCDTTQECWVFVYPIEIIVSGNTMIINNDTEFFENYDASTSSLVYPFEVLIAGETMEIISPNYFYEIGEFENMCE